MVGLLLLVAALSSPAVSNAGEAPGRLHEISHVSSLDTVCTAVVVHANAAIASALHNDTALGRAATVLRAIDLGRGAPGRRSGLAELRHLTAEVAEQSTRGTAEIKRLRSIADDTPEGHQTIALRAFSLALDGAIERQRRLAHDLDALLDYIAYEDIRDVEPISDAAFFGTNEPPSDELAARAERIHSIGSPPEGPYQTAGRTENTMARSAAADFDTRLADIVTEETRAADRTDEAIIGC